MKSHIASQPPLMFFAIRLLETFHAALVTHAVFVYTIVDHGSLNHLNDGIW